MLVAMAKNIPRLFRSLKEKQTRKPNRTKTIRIVSTIGEGQRIGLQLYCIIMSLNERNCHWCLEHAAVRLAENTFFYGANNRPYNQTTTRLYYTLNEFDMPAVTASVFLLAEG